MGSAPLTMIGECSSTKTEEIVTFPNFLGNRVKRTTSNGDGLWKGSLYATMSLFSVNEMAACRKVSRGDDCRNAYIRSLVTDAANYLELLATYPGLNWLLMIIELCMRCSDVLFPYRHNTPTMLEV